VSDNPYESPAAQLEAAPKAVAEVKLDPQFPVALLARFLVGIGLTGYGLYRAGIVISAWSWLADRSIIDALANPYIWLTQGLCFLAAGALMLARSKWLFIPILLFMGHAAWMDFHRGWPGLSSDLVSNWSLQIALFAFAFWLLLKGRLR